MVAFCVEGTKVLRVWYSEEPWHDGQVVRHKCPGPGEVVDVCLSETDARLVCERMAQDSQNLVH